jgi:hypothetical protein
MTRRYHKRSKRIATREITDEQRDDLIFRTWRKLGEKKPSLLVDSFKINELPLWESLKEREDAWRNIREELMTDRGRPGAWWDYEAPPGELPGRLTGRYEIAGNQVEPEVEKESTLLHRLHLLDPREEAALLMESKKEEEYPPAPTFTWEEILAMKGKHDGIPLTLYVESWEEPNLPLPKKGNPPDWEAIRAELDKGPDQNIAPIIQAYLAQMKA